MPCFLHYAAGGHSDPAYDPVCLLAVRADGDAPRMFCGCFGPGDEARKLAQEAAVLSDFADYVTERRRETWVGWGFDPPRYGFGHLYRRFHSLTGRIFPVPPPSRILDLREELTNRFGPDFANPPTLLQTARNNGVETRDFLYLYPMTEEYRRLLLDPDSAGQLWRSVERHCAMIEALYGRLERGELAVEGQRYLVRPGRSGEARDHQPEEERDASSGADDRTAAAMSVYTNGVVDQRFQRVLVVASNNKRPANERLTEIDQLFPIPRTASAEELGRMLGVSKQAVAKTDWWQNRIRERERDRGSRRDLHRGRSKTYERRFHDDDD